MSWQPVPDSDLPPEKDDRFVPLPLVTVHADGKLELQNMSIESAMSTKILINDFINFS